MRSYLLLATAACCALAGNAQASVLTENFDTPFEQWETRWFGTQSNAANYYVSENGSDATYQGAQDVGGMYLSDGDSYRDGGDYGSVNVRFLGDFAASLTSLQMDVATALPNTALNFFDRSGNVISSFTIAASPLSAYYTPTGYRTVAVSSANGIAGFSFLGFAQGNVIVDNLIAVTATSAVPEPASWAMMLIGVGAVGGMIRRRKAVNVSVRFA